MSEMVRLGDVFNISSGGTPNKKHSEYYEGGTIPWIKTGDLKEMYISNHVEYITQLGLENSSAKIFPINTVLVAMYGATIGACSILPFEAATNQACAAFLPSETIIPNYLYYFLCSKKDQFVKDGVGGAQPNISAAYLKNVEIQIPSLNRQKFIISVLDKVSKLIALRKRQLDLLDEMVKARFVEMFGDPVRNEKGWDQLPLIQACKAIFGGGTPSKSHPEYYNGNTPWVTPKDMKRTLITDSIDHITDDAIKNSTTNLVPQNSVLMVIRSGILKHTLPVAINIIPVTINQDMKAFITDELISPIFLMYYFKSIESDVLSGVRGVTADNIDFKTFQRSLIPIPPIELQNQFADFVQQVEKSKATVQQGLDRLNLLKSALMQEYFG